MQLTEAWGLVILNPLQRVKNPLALSNRETVACDPRKADLLRSDHGVVHSGAAGGAVRDSWLYRSPLWNPVRDCLCSGQSGTQAARAS